MKVSFRHKKENVMEALQVTRDRMDVIVRNAQEKMVAEKPSGTKVEMLDFLIRECNDTNEVVAATIVWGAITGQMETQRTFDAMKQEAEKKAFRDKISIHKNDDDKTNGLHLP